MTDITIVKRTQNMDRRHNDKNRNGNSVIFVYTIYLFIFWLKQGGQASRMKQIWHNALIEAS